MSASRDVYTSTSIRNFKGSGPRPRHDQAVMKGEVKFSYFIGEHHLALAVADHYFGIFPDSDIARAFKYGQLKLLLVWSTAATASVVN